jgi:hypothetical protein
MIFDAPNSVHQTAQERKQKRSSKPKAGQMSSQTNSRAESRPYPIRTPTTNRTPIEGNHPDGDAKAPRALPKLAIAQLPTRQEVRATFAYRIGYPSCPIWVYAHGLATEWAKTLA